MKEFGNAPNLPQKTGFWEEKIDLTPPIALFSLLCDEAPCAAYHEKISRPTKIRQTNPAFPAE
jgi:hypothetical protein